jgi:parvulin-like peptidyl-prolyl isomerase
VARSLYPTILCSTLVLAATICLRPGTAQEILNFAQTVRAQAPDPGSYGYGGAPGGNPGAGFPVGGYPGGALPPGAGLNPSMPMPGGVMVPGAMTPPMPTGRFETGAGNPSGPMFPVQKPAMVPGAPAPEALASAQIITTVGPEVILASDLMGRYKAYQEAAAGGASAQQLATMREDLSTQLKNLVDAKLLFIDAMKVIPADVQKDLESQITEQFNTYQLKDLMERTKSKTPEELDVKLHEYGSSLARRRRAFFEQQVGHMWLKQQIKDSEKEIPYTAILAYYQQHFAEYEYKAQARWEELAVRFDRFPTKAEAFQAIADMGNQVLHGVAFADVARARSQGATADQGGKRDWTSKGSLRSTVIDQALFGLPVGGMSQIIEDTDSFHIIRVVERKDAGRVAFTEAQPEIKKKLKEEMSNKAIEEYMTKLRNRTTVWTVFDKQPPPGGQQAPGGVNTPPGFAAAPAGPGLADRRTGDFNPQFNGMQPSLAGPGYAPGYAPGTMPPPGSVPPPGTSQYPPASAYIPR